MRKARFSRVATIEEYFDWLCWFVNYRDISDNYTRLLKCLFDNSFIWFVPNDDNRAFEGLSLRERFCEDLNIRYNEADYPTECTMFELVIGLAIRCSELSDSGLTSQEWFWRLMDNCELSYFDDDCTDDPCEIIEKIVQRTYKRNGKGGFFPVKRNRRDQRKLELWYQMSAYINENYYFC